MVAGRGVALAGNAARDAAAAAAPRGIPDEGIDTIRLPWLACRARVCINRAYARERDPKQQWGAGNMPSLRLASKYARRRCPFHVAAGTLSAPALAGPLGAGLLDVGQDAVGIRALVGVLGLIALGQRQQLFAEAGI